MSYCLSNEKCDKMTPLECHAMMFLASSVNLCLTDYFYFTPWNGIQLTFIFHVRNNDELPLIAKMKQLIDSHPVFFAIFKKQ